MSVSQHVFPKFDDKGNLISVRLSGALWTRGEKRLTALVTSLLEEMSPEEIKEPLKEWDTFISYWDFKYPVNREVVCGCCNTSTSDWSQDPAHPFFLKSAQLGGLVVFNCKSCGATVRKKHFKDHYCFEYTVKK